ncbi:hypothetical protein TWF225_002898 [Orbilia oligospora]|uniref:DNA primase large subunit n=1 Tax=Orbilia oligospora TaxID=2813651 RepID=A0A7C8TU32_ORBOL|nr:hypothetical protein TWF225_002898 [Orbilia oligospora]KAF3180605.1 hypothetical protein TWF751_010980 [Orbilia oligospora]KAF3261872.1 hypothetical protein TWF217_004434 [Orbilia oligospora]KAF3265922.1 hypothetical protein TWF128_011503 [Orbilia oligospora]KAF3290348.1 hypothetical protein TWF132_007133 [Orbilia oligospora]
MLGRDAIRQKKREDRKAAYGNKLDPTSSSYSSKGSGLPYPHRLNFYTVPPKDEVSLEEFEQWAIDRLKVLGEIETCIFRNNTPPEIDTTLRKLLDKYLPLNSNSSIPESERSNPRRFMGLTNERKKDHYSHFILRLAFARSDDLRRRFTMTESILFRHRFNTDNTGERAEFMDSLQLNSEVVGEAEKVSLAEELKAVLVSGSKMPAEKARQMFEQEQYLKVDWDRVSDLVEGRKVFLRRGYAYVPNSMLLSLVMAEFSKRLDESLIKTARYLPHLDEDDRLIPILNHLSKGFTAPEYTSSTSLASLSGEAITASQIDNLSSHFPLCMKNLHTSLRRDKHLRHFGRLQYGLFLKGLGLSIDEALIFWRQSFSKFTDDQFNKEYRYNIRHSYGLQGAGRNYKPYSCQQILMEHPPGAGDSHGCPYRHFSIENLTVAMGRLMGVEDRSVVNGVKQDVEAKKYHLACNRVFEYLHEKELKRKDGGVGKETITHPNEYFDRSWELKNPGKRGGDGTVASEVQVKDEDVTMT